MHVLQCERHEMQAHLEKNSNSHLDLSMMEISRLRRVRFMKERYIVYPTIIGLEPVARKYNPGSYNKLKFKFKYCYVV